MSAEQDLYSTINGASAVTALVGTNIHVDRRDEEDALPAIVYQRGATENIEGLSGAILAAKVTLVVECMADSRSGAEAIADAVVSAIKAATHDFAVTARVASYDDETQTHITTLAIVKNE